MWLIENRSTVLLLILSIFSGNGEYQKGSKLKLTFKRAPGYTAGDRDDRIYPNVGVAFKEVAKLQPTREVYTLHLATQLPDLLEIRDQLIDVMGFKGWKNCPPRANVSRCETCLLYTSPSPRD